MPDVVAFPLRYRMSLLFGQQIDLGPSLTYKRVNCWNLGIEWWIRWSRCIWMWLISFHYRLALTRHKLTLFSVVAYMHVEWNRVRMPLSTLPNIFGFFWYTVEHLPSVAIKMTYVGVNMSEHGEQFRYWLWQPIKISPMSSTQYCSLLVNVGWAISDTPLPMSF